MPSQPSQAALSRCSLQIRKLIAPPCCETCRLCSACRPLPRRWTCACTCVLFLQWWVQASWPASEPFETNAVVVIDHCNCFLRGCSPDGACRTS